MMSIDEIKAPINREMEAFELRFRDSMKSSVPLLDKITYYIVKRKGKQIRPMFVFLSAGICGGITESTYRAASLIELLHTATLVHDDVVDDSNERRGFFRSMPFGRIKLQCWWAITCFREGCCYR
jgi:octaprenyl-diphosphate synthase